MTLRKATLVLLAASAVACSVDGSIQPQCAADTECPRGATCNLSVSPHVCVSSCPTLCSATDTCVDGACVPTTCIPACNSNQSCDTSQKVPKCVDLTDGTVTLSVPAASAVVGGARVSMRASAGAPGGPTQVVFRIEQGGATKAQVTATTGNGGIYTTVMPLTGAGLVSGPANVFAKVSWNQNGILKTKDSASVAVTVDEDAPSITGPSTDHLFYSSTAQGAPPNANVTVQIVDVGSAGVDPATARLSLVTTAHSYPAALAPGGGAGGYQFAVPAADLGVGANQQGSVNYLVTASDKVGNAGSFDGGVINVDNEPPTFANAVVPAGIYGGDAGFSVSIDVVDPAGGAGLDPASIGLLVGGATSAIPATGISGATASFAIHGKDLQSPGVQGPVTFNFVAKDNVLNQGTSPPQSVTVDYQAPAIGAVTVTDNPAAGDNGYYAASGGITVPVSVPVDDGAGSGVASATLTVNGQTVLPTGSSSVGTVKTFVFAVPAMLQTPGSEAPLSFKVNATDNAGNAVTQTASASLKIDAAGPVVHSVATNTVADAVVTSIPWFNQSGSGDIDVKANITDLGSGVNLSSLKLVVQGTSTRVDRPGMVMRDAGTDNYHFQILRSGGPVGLGQQGPVTYQVIALDNLGHPQKADVAGSTSSVSTLGIDGLAPTITFTPTYPASGTGCGLGVVCGHDGSHFWRLGDDGSALSFTAADPGGSGPNLASAATCTIAGGTPCIVSYPGASYSFTINPSKLLLTSTGNAGNTDSQGEGTVAVTVTAKDAVGNQASNGPVNVKVTRLRWVKQFASVTNIRGSPVVTPPIGSGASAKSLILLAGTNTAADPIFALDKTGAVVSSAGHAQGITTVTNNMAYSPVTNTLYVTQDGSRVFNAFTVAANSIAAAYSCTLSVTNAAKTSGPPAIIGTSAVDEAALVADTGQHKLWALSGGGGNCSVSNPTVTIGTTSLGPPTTNNSTVYLAYDATGIATTAFASSSFSGLTKTDLSVSIAGSISLATNLFFGETRNYHSYSANVATNEWTVLNAGHMAAPIISSPIVAQGLVIGVSQAGGRAFNQTGTASTAGVQAWDTGNLGSLSAPIVAAGGGVAYFSDGANNELVATPFTSSSVGPANWNFVGDNATKNGVNLGFSGPGSGPTLAGPTTDQAGVLFFGADNGNFYAIMTDSAGSFVPTAGTDWPRVGFDNCNSGNSSYTNCH